MDQKPKYLTAKEVAVMLGLELSTFRKMVAKGALPQAYQVGPNLRLWAKEDVKAMEWHLRNAPRFRKSTLDEEDKDAGDG